LEVKSCQKDKAVSFKLSVKRQTISVALVFTDS